MATSVYLDESKARRYLLVGVALEAGDETATRRALRRLLLPSQRRIHMKLESDRRRRLILSTLARMDMRVTIYDAGGAYRGTEKERRRNCLDAAVEGAKRHGHARLVIERDDGLVTADRIAIIACSQRVGLRKLTYEHRRAREELLLSIPNAIAWAWARGGDWRRRVRELGVIVKTV